MTIVLRLNLFAALLLVTCCMPSDLVARTPTDTTLSRFISKVEELNRQFAQAPPAPSIKSWECAKGHYFVLRGREAAVLASQGLHLGRYRDIDALQRAFPTVTVRRDLLVVRGALEEDEGRKVLPFFSVPIGDDECEEVMVDELLPRRGGRLQGLSVHKLTIWEADAVVSGFFFETEMQSSKLPASAANMIAYVDHIADPRQPLLHPKAHIYEDREGPVMVDGLTQGELMVLLDSLRHRRVVGDCSQDESPLEHTQDIALVASRLGNWDAYIHAELALLNDSHARVARAGSGWGPTAPALQNLEALGLDMVALMIGQVLRAQGLSPGHAYGNIGRIGQALADYPGAAPVVSLLLAWIQEPNMDLVNRVILVNVMLGYIEGLSGAERANTASALRMSIQSLPDWIQPQVIAANPTIFSR